MLINKQMHNQKFKALQLKNMKDHHLIELVKPSFKAVQTTMWLMLLIYSFQFRSAFPPCYLI